METKNHSGVLAAGLALFSMFFGAGDLLWPLILGGASGDMNFFAMCGLLVTGVSLPLLGVIAMLLFKGDLKAFFGRIGVKQGIVLLFIIQVVLGPIGSIPRLFTLSYATLSPYLPDMSLGVFSALSCVLVLAFAIRKNRLVEMLGLILTPILLLSLGAILIIGLVNPPAALASNLTTGQAFTYGLNVGYNTLDLIASFIFAPVVLFHFCKGDEQMDTPQNYRNIAKKMFKASFIAAGLLSMMYVGLSYIASYYTPLLPPSHLPEERLAAISMYLLGEKGAIVSCIAVSMTCLTTAIPMVIIFANYFKQDLMRDKVSTLSSLIFTLVLSWGISNLGFMGIANLLSPILQILCPGLIVLSVLNIASKIYEITHATKAPVYAAFGISTVSYLVF